MVECSSLNKPQSENNMAASVWMFHCRQTARSVSFLYPVTVFSHVSSSVRLDTVVQTSLYLLNLSS